MVNKIKLDRHISNLKHYLEELSDWANVDETEFLDKKVLRAAAERYLQMAIETCINMGNHVIATNSWRNPEDYSDIFKVLEENGVIDHKLTESLIKMARFRNRLVHLYWDIEPKMIYRILKDSLPDIKEFARAIVLKHSDDLKG